MTMNENRLHMLLALVEALRKAEDRWATWWATENKSPAPESKIADRLRGALILDDVGHCRMELDKALNALRPDDRSAILRLLDQRNGG
jgi:hypothetical protein